MPPAADNYVERQQYKLYFKNILRKVFLEDWLMKVVALVITLALWIGVTGLSEPGTRQINGVALTLDYSTNTILTNEPIEKLDIVVSGDKRKLKDIVESTLVITVDMTDVAPGSRVVTLTRDNVSIDLPAGVKWDEIRPNKVAVRLEAVEEKDIAVQVETAGQVPDGMEIYSQTITPPKIPVRGPASFIKALTSVTTDKIDLTNKGADFTTKQVSVNVSNPKATLLETVVDVSFRIGEKRTEKTFVVQSKGDPKRKVTVVLFGGRSLFEGVKADDLQVEFVKNSAGEDSPQVTLPASLQDKVEVRKPKPAN